MTENEMSFLVAHMPDLSGVRSEHIDQFYLDDSPDPLRLRRCGDVYELTKKVEITPGDHSRKDEKTIMLDAGAFAALRPSFQRGLAKTRYYLQLDHGLVAELDVFEGDLAGLSMVEVEFPNERMRTEFVPPAWFGRDVSQDEWTSNAYLAGKTFKDIEHFLKG